MKTFIGKNQKDYIPKSDQTYIYSYKMKDDRRKSVLIYAILRGYVDSDITDTVYIIRPTAFL